VRETVVVEQVEMERSGMGQEDGEAVALVVEMVEEAVLDLVVVGAWVAVLLVFVLGFRVEVAVLAVLLVFAFVLVWRVEVAGLAVVVVGLTALLVLVLLAFLVLVLLTVEATGVVHLLTQQWLL